MRHKKNLQVLILGEWDFAGCGYFLSQAINQNTDSTSRSVRFHKSTLGFPFDIQAPTDDDLAQLWKRADVVHIHDDYRPLPPDLQAKPTVVTYHGTLYRTSPKSYDDKAKALGWVQTAATLDLTLLGPRWLPDTRPDMSQYVNRSPVFKACHAPTKRKVKGTSAVLQACRKVVDLDLIEGVQWTEALKRKGQCWVTIDQFQLGYGCNAIEAWMMGQPVIGGGSKAILDVIERPLPMLVANEHHDSIKTAIEMLKSDSSFYDRFIRIGSDYVNRFHAMPAVANRALEYYHEAIEAFYTRGMVYAPTPIAKAVAKVKQAPKPKSGYSYVEYIGKSYGWVPFEVNGNKYRFCRSKPIQMVEDGDISTLLEIRDISRRVRGSRSKVLGDFLFRRV